ncbi:uncharacterized protein UDID_17705 [Ustilago sp. UG-2017a]|nr:uncharacterized protein UDID_17705 [Ustilago sp. UG-2017a]
MESFVETEESEKPYIEEEAIEEEAIEGEAIEGEAIEGEAIEGELIEGELIEGELIEGELIEGGASSGDPCNGGKCNKVNQKYAKLCVTGPVETHCAESARSGEYKLPVNLSGIGHPFAARVSLLDPCKAPIFLRSGLDLDPTFPTLLVQLSYFRLCAARRSSRRRRRSTGQHCSSSYSKSSAASKKNTSCGLMLVFAPFFAAHRFGFCGCQSRGRAGIVSS